ncbi:hypothetical protein HMPREF3034_01087 [Prevotella sp. DNF00663]|nr:hypothetical protein HMPREF3034_01087 [Prevotella sp. DNF00663]
MKCDFTCVISFPAQEAEESKKTVYLCVWREKYAPYREENG